MSPPTTPHLDSTVLANFAQEKLSRKKTQRILDHGKQCPGCANQLMEAVREQTPPTPLKAHQVELDLHRVSDRLAVRHDRRRLVAFAQPGAAP